LVVALVMVLLIAAVGAVALLKPRRPASSPASRACGPDRSIIAPEGAVPGACKVEMLGSGASAALADVAGGKPMVINFWATWCGSCVQEMPDFQSVYASVADRVQFLGLDLLGVEGEVRSAATSFARQRAVRYPLAYDEGGLLYSRISLRVLLPTTAFVRADGTLAGYHIGQVSAPELRQLIKRHFGIEVPA
jgi:thiol-disulfide isomerase/thioredoxin